MNKLALSAVCLGALIVPNICSAKDSDAIDHFDPMTSFEVVVKAPTLQPGAKLDKADKSKRVKTKSTTKATLAAAD